MPNWVEIEVRVEGPSLELSKFLSQVQSDEQCFDFNKIIKMPKCLIDTTSGTAPNEGMYALMGVDLKRFGRGQQNLSPKDRCKNIEYLLENRPESLIEAVKSFKAFKETGYYNWYDWSVDEWGTKWNACDPEITRWNANCVSVNFTTAWSFPEPIFRRLADLFPRLVFKVTALEESFAFACRGEFNGDDDFEYYEPEVPGESDEDAA
jgi:hypothetical protein